MAPPGRMATLMTKPGIRTIQIIGSRTGGEPAGIVIADGPELGAHTIVPGHFVPLRTRMLFGGQTAIFD